MKYPTVSIIMPVYNISDYIEESVISLLNQTYKDFELIVMDDSSTDDTLKKLKTFKDRRLKVIKSPVNQGVAKCLNQLLQSVQGEYIARADGDDIYFPKRLEYQVKFLDQHPEYVMVGSNAILIDANNKKLGNKIYPRTNQEIKKKFHIPTPLLHPTVIIRKSAFDKVGSYREYLNGAEDYDLFFRLSSIGKLYNLQQFLIKRRMHPQGVSLNKPINREFKALMVKTIHLPKTIKYYFL